MVLWKSEKLIQQMVINIIVQQQIQQEQSLDILNSTWTVDRLTFFGFSHTFYLLFKVPPWIIGAEQETIVQAKVGKSITLICPAIGTPKPTIRWFKNDKPLQSLDLNEQYVLTNIKHTDEGIYRCVATNKAGTTYRAFNVSVHSND